MIPSFPCPVAVEIDFDNLQLPTYREWAEEGFGRQNREYSPIDVPSQSELADAVQMEATLLSRLDAISQDAAVFEMNAKAIEDSDAYLNSVLGGLDIGVGAFILALRSAGVPHLLVLPRTHRSSERRSCRRC